MRLSIVPPQRPNERLTAANDFRLPPGEVHLWWTGLRVEGAALCACWDCLPSDEARQASKHRYAKDCREFVVRRAVLRQLLARYSGQRAAELLFGFGSDGKPVLRNVEDLHFSMSHACGIAVTAIARRPVGIDLEHVQKDLFGPSSLGRALFGEALIEQCLSGREQSYVRGLPAEQRNRALYRCWTRKEAVLKALGTGLLYPPQQVNVVAGTKRTCVIRLFGRDWLVRQVAAPRGYAAAVAIEEPHGRVVCRSRKFPVETFFGGRSNRNSTSMAMTLEPQQIA